MRALRPYSLELVNVRNSRGDERNSQSPYGSNHLIDLRECESNVFCREFVPLISTPRPPRIDPLFVQFEIVLLEDLIWRGRTRVLRKQREEKNASSDRFASQRGAFLKNDDLSIPFRPSRKGAKRSERGCTARIEPAGFATIVCRYFQSSKSSVISTEKMTRSGWY